MKNGFSVFLATLIALGASWGGFVLAPVLQLGRQEQTTILNSPDPYPIQRTGAATLGLQVYRANNCAACHTTQVRQDGVKCEIELTSVGKNPAAVQKQINDHLSSALRTFGGVDFVTNGPISYGGHEIDISHLPQTIFNDLSEQQASAVAGAITAAGGKSETHIVATGADISRGWGTRRSVAEDFLWDYPVQLGSLRVGPDLADVGARLPDANWQLLHLYAPRSVVKNSLMPSFKFLFEVRPKINGESSPDALNLPKEFAPPAGYEVVPKPEAKELAAYLLSLRADVPLHDAPFSASTKKK